MNQHESRLGQLLDNAGKDVAKVLEQVFGQLLLVPDIQPRLGWRAIVPMPRFADAWTFRVASCPGRFGLILDAVNTTQNGWTEAIYRLYYFPKPGDRGFGRYSQRAQAYARQAGFDSVVSEFAAYPELATYFETGQFTIAIDPLGKSLTIGLKALARRRTISLQGLLLADARTVLVGTDRLDESVPAYALGFQFFKVAAATVAFVVEEPAIKLSRSTYVGWNYVRSIDGSWQQLINKARSLEVLRLEFGEPAFDSATIEPAADTPLRYTEQWQPPEPVPRALGGELWWHVLDTVAS